VCPATAQMDGWLAERRTTPRLAQPPEPPQQNNSYNRDRQEQEQVPMDVERRANRIGDCHTGTVISSFYGALVSRNILADELRC
jgi:hypothetical protein